MEAYYRMKGFQTEVGSISMIAVTATSLLPTELLLGPVQDTLSTGKAMVSYQLFY